MKQHTEEIILPITQTIDLGKKYYAQIEFSSYNPNTYKVEDSKLSEMVCFQFDAGLPEVTDAGKGKVDISKIQVKAPKIISANFTSTDTNSRLKR